MFLLFASVWVTPAVPAFTGSLIIPFVRLSKDRPVAGKKSKLVPAVHTKIKCEVTVVKIYNFVAAGHITLSIKSVRLVDLGKFSNNVTYDRKQILKHESKINT
ncbi:hypothetical protein T02_15026 [Trichinella nativa]|uniref:Uncharacterized protein n=1 Tax=Trichinella nativa TaxID=6335 RepID=A0A0V1LPJ0_9BILA|nr:hypothetical protein T02_15026 [Trichinella nativa]